MIKNSFCREDVEIWAQGFPAREENWTGTREEERQEKRQSKLLSLYVQIIARMSHYSAHYNRYHSFYTHISLVCRNKLLCLLILKRAEKYPYFQMFCCMLVNLLHYRHPYSEKDSFGGNVHHTRNQKATIKVNTFSD